MNTNLEPAVFHSSLQAILISFSLLPFRAHYTSRWLRVALHYSPFWYTSSIIHIARPTHYNTWASTAPSSQYYVMVLH